MTQKQRSNRLDNTSSSVVRYAKKKLSSAIVTLFIMVIALGSLNATANSASNINVLSSIKPIQLISTAIIGDLGQSNILLPPSANPHNYQLRPSQRALLGKADLFVWVGPELELFLVKVLKSSSIQQLTLTKALHLNSSSNNELDAQSHDEHSHDTHNHGGSFDPHIWLNPAFSQQIAEAIYQQLSAQHPQLETQLKQNLDQFIAGLSATEGTIKEQFKSKKQIPIYTFHQAFTHFADHYGLKIAGTITRTPEARPGARHLSELTQEIRQKNKICLIKEPNFKAPYVDSITRGTEVILTIADPLATDINDSETGYFEFIQSIADSFFKCMQ